MRSLQPSSISLVWCVIIGINLVGFYLLMCSVTLGTSFPMLANGDWSVTYTNDVVQPLLAIFSSLNLTNALFLLWWAVAGLVVYVLVEQLVRLLRGLRSAEHTVQMTPNGIVQHPTRVSFLQIAAWRLVVLLAGVPIIAIAAGYPLRTISTLGPEVVIGQLPNAHTIIRLVIVALGFAVVGHLLVIFLRLFTLRTRLMGDELLG